MSFYRNAYGPRPLAGGIGVSRMADRHPYGVSKPDLNCMYFNVYT